MVMSADPGSLATSGHNQRILYDPATNPNTPNHYNPTSTLSTTTLTLPNQHIRADTCMNKQQTNPRRPHMCERRRYITIPTLYFINHR
jgi:hypothetical protein